MTYVLELNERPETLPLKENEDESMETQMRHSLVQFGKMLHAQGFVAACDGNLSVRLDGCRFMVTPTGVSKCMMQMENMVIVDAAGRRLSGNRKPTSEIAMHLTIYKMRPDIGAVVHAHPCTATAFASAGIALDEPLCSEIVASLETIPLAPYATPGTNELSESLKTYIPGHDAILMANHGVVTYAEDLLHAYLKMEMVEHFAKIALAARQLGIRKPLSASHVQKLLDMRNSSKRA